MEHFHPFRFGVVAAGARSGQEWVEKARRIESLGYATLVVPDGLQYTLAPLSALAVAAAATSALRVGTYVLANDLHHPVLVAKEVATLDLLSGGRVELGLGAGRPDSAAETRMLGYEVSPGRVRVERLAESLSVVKALLAGETVTSNGSHYTLHEARVSPLPVQKPLPILVAGSGRQLLSLAARQADVVALGVGPESPEQAVVERVGWLREAAGERFAHLELNLNLMAVGQQVPRFVASQMGLTAEGLAQKGSIAALVGTTEQMCDTLQRRRERLGISYIMVSDELMDALAPVVERLAGR